MDRESRSPVVTPDLPCDEITGKGNVHMPRAVCGLRLTTWRKAISNRLLISVKENGVYTKQSQKVHPDPLPLICTVHTPHQFTHGHTIHLPSPRHHFSSQQSPTKQTGLSSQYSTAGKLIQPFRHCPSTSIPTH